MASTVFNLGAVKLLKKILRFQESELQIITGNTADPTVTAVDAVAGSIYIRSGTNQVYVKNSDGNNTDFSKLGTVDELNAHVNDTSDAHDASAISNVPSGNLAATDVQAALNELQSDVDARALDSAVIKKDGSVAYTAAQSMGGFKITSLAAGTASSDAVNKGQLDAALEGLKPKAAVRVATTANITIATALNAGDVLDGVTLANGDRVLVKDQTAAEANGIYVVSATPSRATDFDSLSPIDEINGSLVAVQEGTDNAGKVFVQAGAVAVLDTDPINFVFFNSSASIVGGDGITVSGSNVSVDHDGNGLTFSAGQLALELDGATLAKGSAGLKLNDTAVTASSYGSATQVGTFTVDAQGRLTAASNTSIAISSAAVTDFAEAAQDAVGATLTDSATIDLTYDDGANTITADVIDASITDAKIAAGIDAAKIGAGNVSNTEFDYLNGTTSAIQTQLDGKANQALSNLSTTSINQALLPSADLTRNLGSGSLQWNNLYTGNVLASAFVQAGTSVDVTTNARLTNNQTTPSGIVSTGILARGLGSHVAATTINNTDVASSANTGNAYIESGNIDDAGSSGNTGSINLKTGTNAGSGLRGIVSIDGAYISVNNNVISNLADPVLTSDAATKNYVDSVIPAAYTDEQAQDAVGGILTDSATIDFTYNDGANTITAIVIDASITDAKVATGIDAAKLADGSVSNTELQYINSLTSNAQTQLDAKEPLHNTTLVQATNASLGANVTNEVVTALSFAHASFNGCSIDYRIAKGTLVRTGKMILATDGTNVAFNDMFVETVDSTIVFEAVVNGANINIRHTNTESGTITFTYQQNRFAV